MKLLTVLPEDWKPEIDYSEVSLLTYTDGCGDNITRHMSINQYNFPLSADKPNAVFYKWKGVVLEPINGSSLEKPRPEDSIKLSECDGRHLILGDVNNDTGKCRAVRIKAEWVLTNSRGGFMDRNDSLLVLITDRITAEITNIRIYDMTRNFDSHY